MKRIFKLFIVLGLLTPFVTVNAAEQGIYVTLHRDASHSVTENIIYKTPVGLGKPESSDLRSKGVANGYYRYYMTTIPYHATYGSATMNLTCIDPGLEVSVGSSLYCKPIQNAKMASILKQGQSVQRDLAVRYLAAQAGYTKGKYSMGALKRQGWAGLEEIGGTNYISSAMDLVNNAAGGTEPNAANFIFKAEYVSHAGNTITAKVTSGSPVRYTPKFKCVTGSGCTGDPTVNWAPGSAEGTITFTVDAPDNCNAQFTVEYDATTGGLYLCYPTSSSPGPGAPSVIAGDQWFVGYLSDTAADAAGAGGAGGAGFAGAGAENSNKFSYPITVKIPDATRKSICPSECDCNVSSEMTYDIHLCCSEAAQSFAKEPNINEIFCTLTQNCVTSDGKISQSLDKQINVPGAYDKDSSQYKTEDSINDFCQTYCTERVYVSLPGASKGRNGRYFEFTKNSQGGDGPVIKGTMSCRNIIYYNKWLKQYVDTTKSAVESYNNYQKNINSYYAYKDILETTNNEGSKPVSITATYSTTCTICAGTDRAKTISCSADSSTVNYTMSYKKHITSTKQYSYKKAKIQYKGTDHVHGFTGLKIVEGDNDKGAQSATGYYDVTWSGGSDTKGPVASDFPESKGCTSSTESCNSLSTDTADTVVPSGSCTETAYRSVDTSHDADIKESYDSTMGSYKSAATSDSGSYDSARAKLTELKEKIEACDKYYQPGGPGNNSVEDKFDYQHLNFVWFVAYVNYESIVNKDENIINLTPSCSFNSTSEIGTSGSVPAGYDGGGVESPHYDSAGTQKAGMENFKDASIRCSSIDRNRTGEDGVNCKSVKVSDHVAGNIEIDQKYTSDNLYYYTCSYTYPNNRKQYTVYPYAGKTELDPDNQFIWQYTKYEGREFIQHSTIMGTYETRWENLHLGSIKGGKYKFDDLFNNQGQTCTKEAKSSVDPGGSINFYCTLSVDSDLVKIQGCPTSLDAVSSYENSAAYWKSICCNTGFSSGDECQKITDDSITMAFKTSDSIKLFTDASKNASGEYDAAGAPVDSRSGKKYAYNWFSNTRGTKALMNIENTSKNDELYDPDRITYEFDLTPNALTAIKDYNATINNYNDIKQGSYSHIMRDSLNNITHVKKYHSNFIEAFYGTNSESGKVVLTYTEGASTKKFRTNVKALSTTALDTARDRVYWDCFGEESEPRCGTRYLNKTW